MFSSGRSSKRASSLGVDGSASSWAPIWPTSHAKIEPYSDTQLSVTGTFKTLCRPTSQLYKRRPPKNQLPSQEAYGAGEAW